MTDPTLPDPTPPDPTLSDDDPGSEPTTRRPATRGLPVGPLGLLLITAFSLTVAFGVAMLLTHEDNGAVPLQEALDEAAGAPLVINADVRAEIGSAAPNVRLEMLDGSVTQLADIVASGKPTLVNFWSSTCVPCLKEMPTLEQLHQDLGDELNIVGINVGDSEASGSEMVERTGVSYPSARDPRGDINAVYGTIGLPRTVLIAGDGTIVDMHIGELTMSQFRDKLAENDLLQA